MTARQECSTEAVLVAIDVAKAWNVVLMEKPDGKRQRFRVANTRADHDRLVALLKNQGVPCQVALEPTGNYHRPLAHRLLREGFDVHLVSSLAAARFREAMFNSWDKNDPKDTVVILELLKQGRVLRYYDPVTEGTHDLQDIHPDYIVQDSPAAYHPDAPSATLLARVRSLLALFASELVRPLSHPLPRARGSPSTGSRSLHPRGLGSGWTQGGQASEA